MRSDKFTGDADDMEWFEVKPQGGSKDTDAPKTKLRDITEIRFENFNKLMEELREQYAGESEHGMLNRFAEKAGMSPAYLSHIRNGRKNIGHRSARTMEKAFGYPTGWLDQIEDAFIEIEDDESEFVEAAIALYRSLPKNARSSLLEFLKAMTRKN